MLQEVAEDDEGLCGTRRAFDVDGRGETDLDSDRDLGDGGRIWARSFGSTWSSVWWYL